MDDDDGRDYRGEKSVNATDDDSDGAYFLRLKCRAPRHCSKLRPHRRRRRSNWRFFSPIVPAVVTIIVCTLACAIVPLPLSPVAASVGKLLHPTLLTMGTLREASSPTVISSCHFFCEAVCPVVRSKQLYSLPLNPFLNDCPVIVMEHLIIVTFVCLIIVQHYNPTITKEYYTYSRRRSCDRCSLLFLFPVRGPPNTLHLFV